MGQRSLKVIEISAIRELGSYSPSMVTMTVLVPFVRYSVSKNGVTLKTRLGVAGSFKVIQNGALDRPYANFYWSAIANIALSCTVFELFDVE